MEQCDWDSYIKLNIKTLRIMGVWPNDNKLYNSQFYNLYTFAMVTICVVCFILPQVINLCFIYDNLEAVVGTVYILLIEIMAAIKVYYLLKNSKLLKDRVRVLRRKWVNSSQKFLIEPDIKFWKRVYVVLYASCIGCNTFWMVYPFLDKSVEERSLKFLSWYPYDYKKFPLYEMTYVHQVVSATYLTFIHFNVDTTIAGFNVYTGCQIDFLCDNLRNFATKAVTDQQVHKNLIDCIHQHKEILKFVDECNNFFNWILFWHLLMSGVSIGITMFQLTLIVPLSSEFYALISYGLAIVLQIFMYCWFGNEVEVKSNQLAYALFESNWTDLSPEVKRIIFSFTIYLMKPLRISALKIFVMSLETLMKILKTAWSYFALLSQLSSRE